MSVLTRISTFLVFATVVGALIALPVAHAASPTEGKQAPGSGDLRRQELELRKSLSTHPDDAAAHLKLGQMYIDQGNYAGAEQQARAAQHKGDQYDDDADALLAWSLFLEGQDDRLFHDVKPGNRKPRDESIVRLSLGLSQLDSGSLDSAEPLLRDAVRLDPSSWRAHIALARFLILKRKLPEAREQVDAARAAGPGEVGVARIAGELDRAEGNAKGAIANFSEVLKSHPTSLPALAGRADALISLDQLTEAQKDVNTALRLNHHSQLMFLDALINAREGQLNEADQWLMLATASLSSMPIGYYLYGVVDFWLGHADTADYYLAKFQAKQPNVSGVVRVRAEMALQRKDPASAVQLLKPIVEANPGDQAAAVMLARAYLSDGKPDQVIQLDERLATASSPREPPPVDVPGLIMMYGDAVGDLTEIEKIIMRQAPDVVPAMVALRQGDIAKAAEMAESLSASKPDDPWVQNLLGSVRLAQKHLPEAEAIFRRIADKQPDFTAPAFNLIEVLVAEKRLDEAKAVLHDLAQRKLEDRVL